MTSRPVAGSDERTLPESVLLQASDWHVRLQDDPHDLVLHVSFKTWLESEVGHQKAWALLERSIGLTRQHEPAFSVDWQTGIPNLPPLKAISRSRPPPLRSTGRALKRTVVSAVAAALLAIVTGPQVMLHLRANQMTGTGQSRDVRLPDGSRIALGAQTAVMQDFTSRRRRIGLLQGEAFFDVAHEASRPFYVDAADLQVIVTGTAFDVSITHETLGVSVARGSVRVERRGPRPLIVALKPGQRLSVDRETGQNATQAVSPIEIDAWRSGRLAARNASVAEVVELLGRHFNGRIFVRGDTLKTTRVTGVYDLVDPVGSLRTLLTSSGATMTRITPWIIVIAPA